MKKEEKLKKALVDIISIMDGPVKEAAKEAIRLAEELNKATQDNQQAVSYDVGQRFLHTPSGEEYILTRVGRNEAMLINLENGRRYATGVEVRFPHMISEKEFNEIAGNEIKFFELIK